MAMMQIQDVLKTEVWEKITAKFEEEFGATSAVSTFVSDYEDELEDYVGFDYHGLMTIVPDGTSSDKIASIAFMHMGHAFERIFFALNSHYNPLENFFTDGTFTKDGNVEVSKEGTERTTPSGEVIVEKEGKTYSTSDGSFDVGQGSTYDASTTTPPTTTSSASDLFNISRDIKHNEVESTFGDKSGSNHPKTTTSFDDYKVEKTYEDFKQTTTYDDYEETEHKSGNSGIFSKQDLTQREVKLRLKNRILPIYVRMVVDTFSTGVWASDN